MRCPTALPKPPIRGTAFARMWTLRRHLGHSVYRISTEWSRIEPEPGRIDPEAVSRYAEWLAYARERGMQTMLVLWHFTNPAWLTERGAWAWSEAPARFESFVRAVVPALAPHVDWWATINEANTYAQHGWLMGDWPPGKRNDYPGGFAAYAGLAEGHVRARRVIKELLGEATPVGLTHVFPWTHPDREERRPDRAVPGVLELALGVELPRSRARQRRLAGCPVLLRRAVHGLRLRLGRRVASTHRHGLAHRPARSLRGRTGLLGSLRRPDHRDRERARGRQGLPAVALHHRSPCLAAPGH